MSDLVHEIFGAIDVSIERYGKVNKDVFSKPMIADNKRKTSREYAINISKKNLDELDRIVKLTSIAIPSYFNDIELEVNGNTTNVAEVIKNRCDNIDYCLGGAKKEIYGYYGLIKKFGIKPPKPKIYPNI